MKTHKFPRELCYVLGMIFLPFAVAIMTKANLGLSMIAAPTYIISEKVGFLSYGQTEYIAQGVMLALMCLVVKKFKWSYLTAFITSVIYGTVLDFFIWLVSFQSIGEMWMRVLLFTAGMLFTSLGVAMFMNTYLAPCMWDYFVRTVVEEKHLDLRKFKLSYDFVFLIISVVLTLVLFHRFIGVTWGTLVIAACNGNLIAIINKWFNKHFELYNAFPKLAKYY